MIDELKKMYAGKKVLVMGLGLQGGGVGVARFFAELGARVKVTDKKTTEDLRPSVEQLKDYDIQYTLGEHNLQDFLTADVIFKGPSIRWDAPEIKAAQEKGIEIEMELSFFATHCPSKIIGITGTRGKSTTTQMIYETLKENKFSVHLAGSIPQVSTIALLKTIQKDDWVVMELPSWPLSGFHRRKISPHIAVFTNFYPDHLNYYQSMDEYLADKKAIYLYQKSEDYLIVNKSLEKIIKEDVIRSQVHEFTSNDFPQPLKYLKGVHNRENASAVLLVADILKIDRARSVASIQNFMGLSYRQQVVGERDGVSFVNDTTSTTPIATLTAIKSFSDKPIVLILGGNSKNLPTDELLKSLDTVAFIVLLKGSMTDEIFNTVKERYAKNISGVVHDNIQEAIEEAFVKAKQLSPSYVLFSPGATSFAMFRNEFHRGEEFNRIVENL